MCGNLFHMLEMGCCGCLGLFRKPHRPLISLHGPGARLSWDFFASEDGLDNVDGGSNFSGSDGCSQYQRKNPEEILLSRAQNGLICREVPVKETHTVLRSKDENGNKMINDYVWECRIGSGSYGKVALYRSSINGKPYAIKVFHKSHLLKLRVAPFESAMTDVLREVSIMKMLDHPNIVNLIEVIDDPNTDNFYMVLEYVEGKLVCEGAGPTCSLGEGTSRRYLRDIVAGLKYLHNHNIVHGDIKPDNLLVTSSGKVKIGDFSVSQVFEDDDDELRRSPGTPVFTAPECCLGLTYRGKSADTWALGVTLYCMVLGEYPFLGETLQDTYDKIVNKPLNIPDDIDAQLKNLLEGLLCKDPQKRFTLVEVAEHPWVTREEAPPLDYICRCRRATSLSKQLSGSHSDNC